MSNKEKTTWIQSKDIYRKYPNQIINVNGINISLMNPKVLLEYKKELSGEHQDYGINFLKEYIK